jgi:uncharacterized protein (DUF2384 family)
VPAIESVLIDRPDSEAMGAGETAITIVAAASATRSSMRPRSPRVPPERRLPFPAQARASSRRASSSRVDGAPRETSERRRTIARTFRFEESMRKFAFVGAMLLLSGGRLFGAAAGVSPDQLKTPPPREPQWAFPVQAGTLPTEEGPKKLAAATRPTRRARIDNLMAPPDWFPTIIRRRRRS